MTDGRKLRITHPEFVAISSTGRTAAVYAAGEEGADHVDLLLVTRIGFRKNPQKRRPAG